MKEFSTRVRMGSARRFTTHIVTEKNYRIYSTSLGKEVALSDVVASMSSHDVMIFGEEHNDAG